MGTITVLVSLLFYVKLEEERHLLAVKCQEMEKVIKEARSL
jgi:hypothetical protein